jgi:hypothetical protein
MLLFSSKEKGEGDLSFLGEFNTIDNISCNS